MTGQKLYAMLLVSILALLVGAAILVIVFFDILSQDSETEARPDVDRVTSTTQPPHDTSSRPKKRRS